MTDAMAMLGGVIDLDNPTVLDGDEVRGRTEQREYAVTGAELAAYAAATADTAPLRVAGEEAGPAFAFVPLTALLFDVVRDVAGDLGPTGIVHTHQDFRYARPIVAGDRLTVVARVDDLRQGPVGGVVTVVAETRDEAGAMVNAQAVTALVVGSTVVNPLTDGPGLDAVEVLPPAGSGAPVPPTAGQSALSIDRDLATRYADASGDRNPMHLDPAFARSAGFPGVILHGMCTLALACGLLERAHDGAGPASRLAVEFTRPVFPGDRLTAKWRPAEDGSGLAFEVLNRRQRVVMRDGRLALT